MTNYMIHWPQRSCKCGFPFERGEAACLRRGNRRGGWDPGDGLWLLGEFLSFLSHLLVITTYQGGKGELDALLLAEHWRAECGDVPGGCTFKPAAAVVPVLPGNNGQIYESPRFSVSHPQSQQQYARPAGFLFRDTCLINERLARLRSLWFLWGNQYVIWAVDEAPLLRALNSQRSWILVFHTCAGRETTSRPFKRTISSERLLLRFNGQKARNTLEKKTLQIT